MSFEDSVIKVEYGAGETIVTIDDWYITTDRKIDKLKELLIPIVEKTKQGKLVLDFSKVESIASSLLGLLLIIHKKVLEQQGNMEIWNLTKNIQKVFEITQLTKIFKICKKQDAEQTSHRFADRVIT
jgi:Anti-anti-sigma regulatory factor (antagonist of anti-sigma factor)